MMDHGQIGRRRVRPPRGAYAAGFALMLAAGLAARVETLTDWDSWDYAWMAIRKQPSGLCLGRWWFIGLMRLAWLGGSALGLDRADAYVPMQLAVALMTAGGLVAVMHWTFQLTGERLSAICAGLVVGLSPSLLAYSSVVMTEGPTILAMAAGWILWHRALGLVESRGLAGAGGLAVLGGVCFGVAVSMREPALLLGAWPVAACVVGRQRRRWGLLGLAVAGTVLSVGLAVLMAWLWSGDSPVVMMSRYSAYMKTERATYGYDELANVQFLVMHFVTAAPLGALALAVAAVLGVWRTVRAGGRWRVVREAPVADPRGVRRVLAALAISVVPYVLMTWWNPDLSFNYRLLLPLTAMLAPVMGWIAAGLLRRLGVAWGGWSRPARRGFVVMAVVTLGLMGYGSYKRLGYHFASAEQQGELLSAMQQLPAGSAVYPGPGSGIGLYLVNSGAKPYWQLHPTRPAAAKWTPESLAAEARRVWSRGGQVYVNAVRRGWIRAHGPSPEWDAISGFLRQGRWVDAPGPFKRLVELDGGESELAQPSSPR